MSKYLYKCLRCHSTLKATLHRGSTIPRHNNCGGKLKLVLIEEIKNKEFFNSRNQKKYRNSLEDLHKKSQNTKNRNVLKNDFTATETYFKTSKHRNSIDVLPEISQGMKSRNKAKIGYTESNRIYSTINTPNNVIDYKGFTKSKQRLFYKRNLLNNRMSALNQLGASESRNKTKIRASSSMGDIHHTRVSKDVKNRLTHQNSSVKTQYEKFETIKQSISNKKATTKYDSSNLKYQKNRSEQNIYLRKKIDFVCYKPAGISAPNGNCLFHTLVELLSYENLDNYHKAFSIVEKCKESFNLGLQNFRKQISSDIIATASNHFLLKKSTYNYKVFENVNFKQALNIARDIKVDQNWDFDGDDVLLQFIANYLQINLHIYTSYDAYAITSHSQEDNLDPLSLNLFYNGYNHFDLISKKVDVTNFEESSKLKKYEIPEYKKDDTDIFKRLKEISTAFEGVVQKLRSLERINIEDAKPKLVEFIKLNNDIYKNNNGSLWIPGS